MEGEIKKSFQKHFSAEPVQYLDDDREERPTREDVQHLLLKYEDQLFYFHINYNPPPESKQEEESLLNSPKFNKKTANVTKIKEIEEFLWRKFNLYKLKSDRDKVHSLNRSMYIGSIPGEDLTERKIYIKKLIAEMKTEIKKQQRLFKAYQVHIIPSMCIYYDIDDTTEDDTSINDTEHSLGITSIADISARILCDSDFDFETDPEEIKRAKTNIEVCSNTVRTNNKEVQSHTKEAQTQTDEEPDAKKRKIDDPTDIN